MPACSLTRAVRAEIPEDQLLPLPTGGRPPQTSAPDGGGDYGEEQAGAAGGVDQAGAQRVDFQPSVSRTDDGNTYLQV